MVSGTTKHKNPGENTNHNFLSNDYMTQAQKYTYTDSTPWKVVIRMALWAIIKPCWFHKFNNKTDTFLPCT